MAEVAQRAHVRPEVLGVAGPRNGRPHGDGAFALTEDGLLGRHGRDGDGLTQVQEPDLGRRAARARSRRAGRRSAPRPGCRARSARRGPARSCSRRRSGSRPARRSSRSMMPRRRMPSTIVSTPELHPDRTGRGRDPPTGSSCRRGSARRPGRPRPRRRSSSSCTNSSSSCSARQARSSSAAAAAGLRPPGGWCQKRPSSAACTRVPLTEWGDGGSGRRSIWENRKASGQLVKAVTFDGVKVRGGSSATAVRIRRGCAATAHPRQQVEREAVPDRAQEVRRRRG